jgi:hypothetical protein
MRLVAALSCFLLFHAGGWAQESPPEVGEAYQADVDKGWQAAVNGKSPASACAAIKGAVSGKLKSGNYHREKLFEESSRAIEACNFDLPVRYFHAYLDSVVSGERTCMNFMTHFSTRIPALTIQVFEGPGNPGEETEDPAERIKGALEDRIRKDCPDIVPWMLQ